MTRPIEPLFPSHPAHVIYHQHCGHVLRRVLLPDPEDKSQSGCICDLPPEAMWQTRRLERGDISCEIDELTYEARSVATECNACFGHPAGDEGRETSSETESASDSTIVDGSTPKSKRRSLRSAKRRSPRVAKRTSVYSAAKATPASKLAMKLGKMELERSPVSPVKRKRKSKKQENRRENRQEDRQEDKQVAKQGDDTGLTIEERVWKHLRSGPVGTS
ncbi:hypothetical protein TWF696_000653 [Orbilia brochopaga]|uniref:Uncharacterized protein n=1 Tax=Orbilia brochopaga TaxID=3140254 RepID=A0AAV9VCA7_9PEZI